MTNNPAFLLESASNMPAKTPHPFTPSPLPSPHGRGKRGSQGEGTFSCFGVTRSDMSDLVKPRPSPLGGPGPSAGRRRRCGVRPVSRRAAAFLQRACSRVTKRNLRVAPPSSRLCSRNLRSAMASKLAKTKAAASCRTPKPGLRPADGDFPSDTLQRAPPVDVRLLHRNAAFLASFGAFGARNWVRFAHIVLVTSFVFNDFLASFPRFFVFCAHPGAPTACCTDNPCGGSWAATRAAPTVAEEGPGVVGRGAPSPLTVCWPPPSGSSE